MVGGSRSRGSERWAWETLAWTSWRASSMFRDRSNSRVIEAPPERQLELIVLRPSTWTRASSRPSTTSFSTTSGAAPGQETLTEMVGKSTSGNWLMPIREAGDEPEDDGRGHHHPGQDGLLDADFGEVHVSASPPAWSWPARRRPRRPLRPPAWRPATEAGCRRGLRWTRRSAPERRREGIRPRGRRGSRPS